MTFDGKWRITAMDLWDQESLDLVVPANLQFVAGGLVGCAPSDPALHKVQTAIWKYPE